MREKEERIAMRSQQAYRENLNMIYNFFYKDEDHIFTNYNDSMLYGAVAKICESLRIKIVSYPSLIKVAGEKFTLEDIARLSHFPCRKVVLEDKWYQKDVGYLLIWIKEGEKEIPVACVPGKWGGYYYIDQESGMRRKIDSSVAATIKPVGYCIYEPFPNEVMTGKKIAAFAARYITFRDRIAYVTLSLVIMLVSLLLPFLTQMIYDKYINYGKIYPIVELCIVIVVCNIAGLCFGIVRNFAVFRGFSKAKYATLAASYDRLFHMSDESIRSYEAADLGNRIMGIGQVFDGITNQLSAAVIGGICSISYLIVTIYYSPQLTGVGLVILLVGILIMLPCIRYQNKNARMQMQLESDAMAKSYQMIDGVSKIKIAGAESRASLEYMKVYLESKKYGTKRLSMGQNVSVLKLSITTFLSITFYYVTMKLDYQLSLGAFLGFISAFAAFSNAILGLMDALSESSNLVSLYERAKPILEQLPDYEEQQLVLEELTGKIDMDHVSFSYVKGSEPVLKDISLHVKPGEYIGIVGPSGCGKSTLLRLLLGFETPDQGRIYYDGKDIRKLNKRELRKKMGVVLQDGKVFPGSIYENITITAPNISGKRVQEVIEEVGLESDVKRMPMGVHTYLSESGGTISGGQQQRILIARAIVGKPKLLLFDEATSALDNVTQEMVCESLERLNATRIVIAHRLSTIHNCDRILVMDKGCIQEEGTYEELMDKKGLFFQLASRQIS